MDVKYKNSKDYVLDGGKEEGLLKNVYDTIKEIFKPSNVIIPTEFHPYNLFLYISSKLAKNHSDFPSR